MIIDCHSHLVPASLIEAVRKEASTFPSLRLVEGGGSVGFAFAGGKPTRPVAKPLIDVAGRLAWMDAQGIDRQVVGGWLDMFGYELPPEEGERWSRLANDHLQVLTACEPRLIPLATVPLQDGARAAAVLRSAVAAGCPGAMIGTLPRGVGSVLDSDDLEVFWATADDLGAAIHIHPSFDAGDERTYDYGLQNAVGRITDAMVAVARLICKGHVARYKNIKFIAPMGSCGLPFLVGRLRRNFELTPGLGDPVEALTHIYTDTVLHDSRVLRFVIEIVGADRIMMGSDQPFPIGDLMPTKIVAAAGVDGTVAARFNGGLAAEMFRLR